MTWNCLGLTFVKKTSMPNPVKALDISSATAQVAPDLLKSVAILSDTTVRIEKTLNHTGNQKKATFL